MVPAAAAVAARRSAAGARELRIGGRVPLAAASRRADRLKGAGISRDLLLAAVASSRARPWSFWMGMRPRLMRARSAAVRWPLIPLAWAQ